MNKRQVTIVTYHYVRDLKNSRYPAVKALTVSKFKDQLVYIKRHYSVITMENLLDAHASGGELPANALLLTFDDGYADHFNTVFPILDNLGLQGSFFPPFKAVLEHEVLDVNKIHFILATVPDRKKLLREIFSELNAYRRNHKIKSNQQYVGLIAKDHRFDDRETLVVKRLLQRELPEKIRSKIVDKLFKKYVTKDEAAFASELYVTMDQLRCMKRNGMYIGGHGYSHCWLGRLAPSQQKKEVDMMIKNLDTIGVDTRHWVMCYPHASYDESLLKLLQKNGCVAGLDVVQKVADLSSDNIFLLPRLDTNDLPHKTSPNHYFGKLKYDIF